MTLSTVGPESSIRGSSKKLLLFRDSQQFADWRLKTEDWRLETGDWRLETGDWRLETEDWRLETGD